MVQHWFPVACSYPCPLMHFGVQVDELSFVGSNLFRTLKSFSSWDLATAAGIRGTGSNSSGQCPASVRGRAAIAVLPAGVKIRTRELLAANAEVFPHQAFYTRKIPLRTTAVRLDEHHSLPSVPLLQVVLPADRSMSTLQYC